MLGGREGGEERGLKACCEGGRERRRERTEEGWVERGEEVERVSMFGEGLRLLLLDVFLRGVGCAQADGGGVREGQKGVSGGEARVPEGAGREELLEGLQGVRGEGEGLSTPTGGEGSTNERGRGREQVMG